MAEQIDEVFAPTWYWPGVDDDAREALLASGRVWQRRDLLPEQQADLVAARVAGRADPVAREEAAAALRREPHPDGVWVYYPWSGVLMRVLAPAQLRELRLDRNRDKITAAEQETLLGKRVGVVGLSVGNAVALTLAQEGVAGSLVLADFDTLGTSNLNRVRAPMHAVGLAKTVVLARQIAEIDPTIDVRCLHRGLEAGDLDAFFDGLDLVIDECDGLAMKVLLRQEARRRRLPVLMETSDRGTLDVERFDLEPDRGLLHGLFDGIDPAAVEGWTAGERLALVARAVGHDVSARAAASMLQIGATLSTWPQLASDVALGGATATAAARRVLLGQPLASGRRRFDMAERFEVVEPATAERAAEPAPERAVDAPPHLRRWVQQAGLAPSGGNAQPWAFAWDGAQALRVEHVRERSRSLLDVDGDAGLLSVGAAIEGLALAASAEGVDVDVGPTGARDGWVATASWRSSGRAADPLEPWLGRRFTDRRSPARRPLPASLADALQAELGGAATLQLCADPGALAAVGQAVGAVDRVRFLHEGLGPEMWAEVRWSDGDARARPTGISLREMHVGPGDAPILRLLSRPEVARDLGDRGLGGRLADLAVGWVDAASAVGLLTAPSREPADLLAIGRGLHRMWLRAVAEGWSIQPIGVVVYMLRHLGGPLEASYRPADREALRRAGATLASVFPAPGHPLFLFRLLVGGERYAPTFRRPLHEVLRRA